MVCFKLFSKIFTRFILEYVVRYLLHQPTTYFGFLQNLSINFDFTSDREIYCLFNHTKTFLTKITYFISYLELLR